MIKKLDAIYWNQRYLDKNIPWDVGYITDPLKNYFDSLSEKNFKILIPGCGSGYEARYLHQQGFTQVYVCDWSQAALDKLKGQTEGFPTEHMICGDFFKIEDSFDLVVEQTFFCALLPSLRKNYVQKMHNLLNFNGKLVGLLFNTQFPNNPPYGGNEEEYRKLFEPFFVINSMSSCEDSIQPRLGSELFVEMTRKKQ